MLKRPLLVLATCLAVAAPALAADTAPVPHGRTCYSVTAPGMTGQYTLRLANLLMKSNESLVARATCTRATLEPPIRSWVTGVYFPFKTAITMVGTGDGGGKKPHTNVMFDLVLPADGSPGTGMFACRSDKGDWAKYDTVTVTKVDCPSRNPAK